jgi:hypothetical protein
MRLKNEAAMMGGFVLYFFVHVVREQACAI